jgi:NitT/TauT family transport system ATP-binding protein
MKIVIKNISKSYYKDSNKIPVLDRISFEIKDLDFISIIGPSGCGKSTLLKIIAGLEKPDNGEITFSGIQEEIKIPIIWQDHRLLPWRTAIKNVILGLEIKNEKNSQEIAKRYLKIVGLSGFENFYPNQLSEGMKARVAIARALAVDPDILLLDEPFASIDYQTKLILQEELEKIRDNFKIPMIYVTHDVRDIFFLSTKAIVLSARPSKVREIFNLLNFKKKQLDIELKVKKILKEEVINNNLDFRDNFKEKNKLL